MESNLNSLNELKNSCYNSNYAATVISIKELNI